MGLSSAATTTAGVAGADVAGVAGAPPLLEGLSDLQPTCVSKTSEISETMMAVHEDRFIRLNNIYLI